MDPSTQKIPETLNPRNVKMPAHFAKALRGDFDELTDGSALTLPGGSAALIFPRLDDEVQRARHPYRAALIEMKSGRYPDQGQAGLNEGRNMLLYCASGEFSMIVSGRNLVLTPGKTALTRDGQWFTISGTGKLFVLADGGETNEYPENRFKSSSEQCS